VSRGQITQWRFVNQLDNDGTIIGCSPDVHGLGFGFSIDDVADPGLANFLRAHPHLNGNVNCAAGPNEARWVTFTPAGNRATNITR
jgi:hypothetical protein